MIKFQSKQAFVAALEGRREFWHTFDERQASEHKAAEQAWFEKSRAKLRRALELKYGELSRADTYLDNSPSCPVLMEAKIDRILTVLSYTQGKTFNVGPSGVWADAYMLLTRDPDAKTTVC